MSQYDKEIAEKGKQGEDALNDWFKKHSLPYMHINQSKETYSSLFPGVVKRPDFFLLIQSIGLIAVDAKNYTLWEEEYYSLSKEEELRKMITFERLFRIPVWFAYMGPDKKSWFWISGLKAIEVGIDSSKRDTGEKFVRIKKSECAEIRTAKDLGKLYAQNMPVVSRIGKMG